MLTLVLKVIAFILPHSRYLNAIQTMCPHILRYLTTAVITNKDVRKRRQVLKDLVKVIQQVKKNTQKKSVTECTVIRSLLIGHTGFEGWVTDHVTQ